MRIKRAHIFLLPFLLLAFLVLGIKGCGGGDSGNGSNGGNGGNTPPVADAGPDQSVKTGSLVVLNGSGSSDADDDPLTYIWSFTSNPGSATLSNSTAVNPTFTPSVDGTYVLSLVVNDGTVDSAADTVAINTVTPVPLPDTGQTTCYDAAGNVINCSGTGQDGEYPMNAMSFTDNGDGTITDNVTGLMWPKQNDGVAYNWYEASGIYNATYNPTSIDVCGSLNAGGYTDWHLPSAIELMSIAMHESYNPAIDTKYFPNIVAHSHISSTPGARLSTSWSVSYYLGGAQAVGKIHDGYVHCVRGNQYPSSHFHDKEDGTILDIATGLVWQKQDTGTKRTWEQALIYCEGLDIAGYTDWRLPNIKELWSIVGPEDYEPSIDTAYFPDTFYDYWSSTTCASKTSSALDVDFFDGHIGCEVGSGKLLNYYARCVRGGQ